MDRYFSRYSRISTGLVVLVPARGWEATHPILTCASCRRLGLGCGLVFLCRGFGCPASAVISFALVFGSRSVLVLAVPSGGGFVCFEVGSRLALAIFASGVGPSRRVRWFRFSMLLVGVGCYPSPWFWSVTCAVVSYLFFFVRHRVWVDLGQNWGVCAIN